MNSNARDATTPVPAAHDDRQSEQGEPQDADDRERPIGAAQLAAPSTRRWRRAERPDRST